MVHAALNGQRLVCSSIFGAHSSFYSSLHDRLVLCEGPLCFVRVIIRIRFQFFLYLNGFLCRFKMVVLSKHRLSCSVQQHGSPGSSRNSPTAAQYSSVPSSQTFLLDSQDDGTEMSVSTALCVLSCCTSSVVVVVIAVVSSCWLRLLCLQEHS